MKYIATLLWEKLLGVCFEGVLVWKIYIIFYNQ